MVYGEIIRQGQLFLLAAALGAGLLLCYDFLRIFRRLIRHKTWGIAAEDLLFWLCCALVMFGFMYRMNEGVIRGIFGTGNCGGNGSLQHIPEPASDPLRDSGVRGKLPACWGDCSGWPEGRCAVPGAWRGRRFAEPAGSAKKGRENGKKQLKKIGKAVRIGLSKL